jgi:hypothetical protein
MGHNDANRRAAGWVSRLATSHLRFLAQLRTFGYAWVAEQSISWLSDELGPTCEAAFDFSPACADHFGMRDGQARADHLGPLITWRGGVSGDR